MAQKKRKHGKVEARRSTPRFRFRLRVPILLTFLAFAGCFTLYMITAVSQPDYWEREIADTIDDGNAGAGDGRSAAGVVNPVPSSERDDESRMAKSAFIGDVAALTSYYETTPTLVFADSVAEMSESRRRSIARSLKGAAPEAVYFFYDCPDDAQQGLENVTDMVETVQEQIGAGPIYILASVPPREQADAQRVDTWNAALFALADGNGLHYVDTNTMLKANNGTLSATYQDEETLCHAIGDLILTHVAE